MNKEDIITGNAFKNLANDFLDEEKTFIDITKAPKTIFLKTDWIELFKTKVLPQINYNFKLITHNADRPAPSNNIDLLEDPRLIRWFGMNCHVKHPKLQSIPIGIANEKWPHGNKQELIEVISKDIPKISLCYSNFDLTTNYVRRPEILKIIQSKSFVNIDNQKHTFKKYLTILKSHKYVISPPGNSIDCHRVWEAIYLGVIPIIERHLAMDYFYDLPILLVDNYNNLTKDILEQEYDSLIVKSTDKAKLKHYEILLSTSSTLS